MQGYGLGERCWEKPGSLDSGAYSQTPLSAGSNTKDTQRNEIWQMDVFHFEEFRKLNYMHHTIVDIQYFNEQLL